MTKGVELQGEIKAEITTEGTNHQDEWKKLQLTAIRIRARELLCILCQALLVLPKKLSHHKRQQYLQIVHKNFHLSPNALIEPAPPNASIIAEKLKDFIQYTHLIQESFDRLTQYLIADDYGFFAEWSESQIERFISEEVWPNTPDIRASVKSLLTNSFESFAHMQQLDQLLAPMYDQDGQESRCYQLNIHFFIMRYVQYAAREYVLSSARNFSVLDIKNLPPLETVAADILIERVSKPPENFKALHEILLQRKDLDGKRFADPMVLFGAFLDLREILTSARSIVDDEDLIEVTTVRAGESENPHTRLIKKSQLSSNINRPLFFDWSTIRGFLSFFPVFKQLGGFLKRLFLTGQVRSKDLFDLEQEDFINLQNRTGGAAIQWFITCNCFSVTPTQYDLKNMPHLASLYVWRFIFQTLLIAGLFLPILCISEILRAPLKVLRSLNQIDKNHKKRLLQPVLTMLSFSAGLISLFIESIESLLFFGLRKAQYLLEIPVWIFSTLSNILGYPFRKKLLSALKKELKKHAVPLFQDNPDDTVVTESSLRNEEKLSNATSLSEWYTYLLTSFLNYQGSMVIASMQVAKARQFFQTHEEALRRILQRQDPAIFIGLLYELQTQCNESTEDSISLFEGALCVSRSVAGSLIEELSEQQQGIKLTVPELEHQWEKAKRFFQDDYLKEVLHQLDDPDIVSGLLCEILSSLTYGDREDLLILFDGALCITRPVALCLIEALSQQHTEQAPDTSTTSTPSITRATSNECLFYWGPNESLHTGELSVETHNTDAEAMCADEISVVGAMSPRVTTKGALAFEEPELTAVDIMHRFVSLLEPGDEELRLRCLYSAKTRSYLDSPTDPSPTLLIRGPYDAPRWQHSERPVTPCERAHLMRVSSAPS